jgi:branched-chain amino acid transport system permease protein
VPEAEAVDQKHRVRLMRLEVPGRTRPLLVRLLLTACVVEVVVPDLLSPPDLLTFNLGCTYALAAIGLSLIFSLGGFVSVAQAAIMASGGYTLILLFGDSVSLKEGLLLAIAAGAAVSALTGVIGARVRSHYFILVSLAIAQIVTLVITNATSVTGGANGAALKGPASLVGLQLGVPEDYFRAIVVLVAVTAYVADSMRASRSGLALRARVVDQYLALSSGIAAGPYRILATGVGGAMAGLAGGMLAVRDSYLGPQNFGLDTAILLLLMVVIAGSGRSGSVVVSALILTFLSQGLLTLTGTGKLIYGLGLILLIIFAPESLGGLTRKAPMLWSMLRARLRPHRTKGVEA